MRPLYPYLFTLLSPALFAGLALFAPALSAQEGDDEPDPFIVIGEKPGDPKADAADGEKGDPKKAAIPPAVKPPKPLSAQISQHIQKLAEAEREKRLTFMKVVIDDIVRLCRLDDEQEEKLLLAAKGASERSMKEWHEQAERYFRTRLESTEGDAAKEMLEGMGSVNFGGNRSEEEGESLALWKDSLKVVLTDEQVAQYEAVLAQRRLDRIDAFARMSISTIDGHLRLTPEQKSKMAELVHNSAATYLDDVQTYWGDYFERGMLMSLANAAEEDQLRAILTEPQFDRLREATSNFDHFWDQKRRLKRAKEKAAERRKTQGEEEEYKDKEAAPAAGGEAQKVEES
jgi:hypothetical protein